MSSGRLIFESLFVDFTQKHTTNTDWGGPLDLFLAFFMSFSPPYALASWEFFPSHSRFTWFLYSIYRCECRSLSHPMSLAGDSCFALWAFLFLLGID